MFVYVLVGASDVFLLLYIRQHPVRSTSLWDCVFPLYTVFLQLEEAKRKEVKCLFCRLINTPPPPPLSSPSPSFLLLME